MVYIFIHIRIRNPTIILYIVTIYIFDREVFKWSFYGEIKLIVTVAFRCESKTNLTRIMTIFLLDFPYIADFLLSFGCRNMTVRPRNSYQTRVFVCFLQADNQTITNVDESHWCYIVAIIIYCTCKNFTIRRRICPYILPLVTILNVATF